MSTISSSKVLRGLAAVAATALALCALCALCAFYALLAPVAATAQPTDKTAQADAAFTEGKELMKAGKLAEACAAFERSQRIDPKVTTLVNLANCREKNGQLATAVRQFSEAAAQLRSATDPSIVALRTLSTDRAAALQPRLSRLTVRLPAELPAGFELLLDSAVVPAAERGRPLPLDGGTYRLTARAPGHQPWSTTLSVRPERDAPTLDVPPLAPAASSRPAPDAAAPPAPLVLDDPSPPPPRRSLALPIGLGVGAVALGGLALGLDLHARDLQSEAIELNDRENATADPLERMQLGEASDDKHESANTYRYVAQGLGVVALGCAGTAIYLLVRGSGSGDASPASARRSVSPVLAPGLAGLQLSGSW